mgnify:FL=1
MSTLYIIGNGFDLQHGLHTSYWDYRCFLCENYPETLRDFESFPTINKDKKELWSDVEKGLKIDYDAIVSICRDICYCSDTKSYNYIGCELPYQWIMDFTGKHFVEWLSSQDCEVGKKFTIPLDGVYVTFNYTDTLERVYGIADNHIFHIHGQLSKIDLFANPLIRKEIQFGTSNQNAEDIQNFLESSYKNHDSYQFILKNVINQISRYAKHSSKTIDYNEFKLQSFISQYAIDNVIIMGHSINGTDQRYYDEILIPKLRDKPWTVFCHNETDRINAKNFAESNQLKLHACNWENND